MAATDTRPQDLTSTNLGRIQVIESPEAIAVSMRSRQQFMIVFLSLWLTGWTVACLFLVHKVITQPSLLMAMFAMPFLAGEVFVVCVLFEMIFGREEMVLNSSGLRFRGAGLFSASKSYFPLADVLSFTPRNHPGDSDSPPSYDIEICTMGASVVCGSTMPQFDLERLASRLNERLITLKIDLQIPLEIELNPADARGTSPPGETRWQFIQLPDEVKLVEAGQWNTRNILMLLFINLFWSSLVGIFIYSLLGIGQGPPAPKGMDWFLFVFLIPFGLIGLAMLVGLVAAIFDFAKQIAFSIGPTESVWSIRYGAIPVWPAFRYRYDSLLAVDVEEIRGRLGNSNQPAGTAGKTFGLSLKGTKGEITKFRGLTRGEAVWMKGLVQSAGYLQVTR
jgi:hypothetical protein